MTPSVLAQIGPYTKNAPPKRGVFANLCPEQPFNTAANIIESCLRSMSDTTEVGTIGAQAAKGLEVVCPASRSTCAGSHVCAHGEDEHVLAGAGLLAQHSHHVANDCRAMGGRFHLERLIVDLPPSSASLRKATSGSMLPMMPMAFRLPGASASLQHSPRGMRRRWRRILQRHARACRVG